MQSDKDSKMIKDNKQSFASKKYNNCELFFDSFSQI